MFKYLLLALFSLNTFALEISLSSAKEDSSKYSTLHIKDTNKFSCNEIKNDFEVTTKIICAFTKQPATKFSNLQNDFFKIKSLTRKNTFFNVSYG